MDTGKDPDMPAPFKIRMFFEWHCGVLWCGDDQTRQTFDVGPIEDRLPLSAETRERLTRLSAWHDTALDWDYPPDPSPWTADERQRFEQAAEQTLLHLREELGEQFEITYEPDRL